MNRFLGVDVGTSALKVVLAEDLIIVDQASKGYPNVFPHDGWSEQRPEDWWDALVMSLDELSARHDLKSVRGISFCGQMHGLVALDEKDRVIRPAILWNDVRTVEECVRINREIGIERLVSWTGNIAYAGFTAPKILWMKAHEPESYKRIQKVMLPKDYLVYRLTGRHVTDVTDASGTLMLDVRHRCWSKEMIDWMGLDQRVLPEVLESADVVGTVLPDVAAKLHVSSDLRVVVGGGDQAVGAIGTGTVGNGRVSISLGTSGVIFASSETYRHVPDGTMHSFCHADGNHHVMAVMLASGGSLRWWTDDVLGVEDIEACLKEAFAAPAGGPLFHPYLSGERSPINDPVVRGAFHGLGVQHKRADLTRAVLEGVCLGFKDCLDAMRQVGIRCEQASVIGGGSKSDAWVQMLSDALGVPLVKTATPEGGALGAVVLAMAGCGFVSNVASAATGCQRVVKTFVPDLAQTEYFAKRLVEYRDVYRQMKR